MIALLHSGISTDEYETQGETTGARNRFHGGIRITRKIIFQPIIGPLT